MISIIENCRFLTMYINPLQISEKFQTTPKICTLFLNKITVAGCAPATV